MDSVKPTEKPSAQSSSEAAGKAQPWKAFYHVAAPPSQEFLPSVNGDIRLFEEKDDKKLGG